MSHRHNHRAARKSGNTFLRRARALSRNSLTRVACVLGGSFVVVLGLIHVAALPAAASPQQPCAVPAGAHAISAKDFQASLSNRVMSVDAYYVYHHSLDDLTRSASAVVIGHVVGNGNTRLVAQPHPIPNAGQAGPSGPMPAGKPQSAPSQAPSGAGQQCATTLENTGVPETHFTVEVTRTLRGAVRTNSRIEVIQLGGQISLPTYPGGPQMQRTVVFSDNPLMKNGDEVLLFLRQNSDGTYVPLAGPQGRFEIARGHIHSQDSNVPVLRDHQGESVDALTREILAAR